METIKIMHFVSPCGGLVLGTLGERLCLCDWDREKRREATATRLWRRLRAKGEEGSSATLQRTVLELEEYFAGARRGFDVPLALPGTVFQCLVWEELSRVPYGKTISYGELARRIGKPSAVRAVAGAVAANPISIIVPCHRVIGNDHGLTGYAGGLEAKRLLISLERKKDSVAQGE